MARDVYAKAAYAMQKNLGGLMLWELGADKIDQYRLAEYISTALHNTIAWNGQGDLTIVPNIVSVAGHFSTGDQRHLVVAGTAQGKVHEIFWKPAQQGIEGQDDLPVAFGAGSIVSVATMYNSDQQRHVVLVGKKDGKVHEIFWKQETVGIEGHDDLPVTFAPSSIVALTGFYNTDQ